MKILQIIASLDPKAGGVTEAVLRISDALVQRGHIVEVACLDAPDAPWLGIDFPVHPLGKRPRKYYFSPLLVPWLATNADRFDVTILNGLWNYSSLGAWRGLRKADVPFVIFPHGMLDPWFGRTYPLKHLLKQLYVLLAEGRVLRAARAVLFTCQEERTLAARSFRGLHYRGDVVPFGTADVEGLPDEQKSAFRQAVPELGGAPFLLFLGRVHPKKGCDILVQAFARVAANHPALHLVMAGPDQIGWSEQLQELAAGLGVADRIHWTGMLSGDVKWGALRAALLFVLPSHQENFGVAVVEAMACRTPVLVTKRVNIYREIEDCGAGLAVEDELESVTDGLVRLLALEEPELLAMGERARSCFLRQFHVASASAALERILEDVVER